MARTQDTGRKFTDDSFSAAVTEAEDKSSNAQTAADAANAAAASANTAAIAANDAADAATATSTDTLPASPADWETVHLNGVGRLYWHPEFGHWRYISTDEVYGPEIVAHLPLDETSGTTAANNEGDDGTYNGSPTLGATALSKEGSSAVTLDGVDDYVEIGGSVGAVSSRDAFSIELMVKPSDILSSFQVIASKHTSGAGGWRISNGGGGERGKLTFFIDEGDSTRRLQVKTAAAHLANGQATHILIRYDGSLSVSGLSIFIDGVRVTLTTELDTLDGETIAYADPLYIGRRPSGAYFAGTVDEFRFAVGEVTNAEAIARAEASVTVSAYGADFGPTGTMLRVGHGPILTANVEEGDPFDDVEETEQGTVAFFHALDLRGKTQPFGGPRYAFVYSTDHDPYGIPPVGGISVGYGDSPQDVTEQGLVYYDTTDGQQSETPCVMWMPASDARNPYSESLWFMYYHNSAMSGLSLPSGYSNQQTLLATSSDLINWTRRGIVIPSGATFGGETVYHTGYMRVLLNNDQTPWRDASGYMWASHVYHTVASDGSSDTSVWIYSRSLDGVTWETDPNSTGNLMTNHQPTGVTSGYTYLGFIPQVWVGGTPYCFGRETDGSTTWRLCYVEMDSADPLSYAAGIQRPHLDGSEMGQTATWEPSAINGPYEWRLHNSFATVIDQPDGTEQVNLYYPPAARGTGTDQFIGLARWEG